LVSEGRSFRLFHSLAETGPPHYGRIVHRVTASYDGTGKISKL
jgi:hypothetical protein